LLQWQNENAGKSGASGDLTRLSISRAEKIGKFQGWKEMRSVIQLAVIKGY
jgi:precorrin-6B methylase 2